MPWSCILILSPIAGLIVVVLSYNILEKISKKIGKIHSIVYVILGILAVWLWGFMLKSLCGAFGDNFSLGLQWSQVKPGWAVYTYVGQSIAKPEKGKK